MFRILGYLFDLLMASSLILMVLLGIFIFGHTLDVTLPKPYIASMQWLFDPFAVPIQQLFGEHYISFRTNKIAVAYPILMVCCIGVFMGALTASSVMFKADSLLSTWVRQWQQKLFMRKVQAQQKTLTSLGNVYVPECGAVLALSFENMDQYPLMAKELRHKLASVRGKDEVFEDDERIILKFASTSEAFFFIHHFYQLFNTLKQSVKISLESQPALRAAVHSLPTPTALFEEERFIWGLVHCTAPNHVYVSPAAKEQFDEQKKSLPEPLPFEVVLVGTFSKIGDRTNPDVYRLVLQQPLPGPGLFR